jgi:hypothetical protein
MSVKIWQRFPITDGIGVEDGQHSERERERERERMLTMVKRRRRGWPAAARVAAARCRWSAARVSGAGGLGT